MSRDVTGLTLLIEILISALPAFVVCTLNKSYFVSNVCDWKKGVADVA